MSNFKFKIGEKVRLTHTSAIGKVIGRAEYEASENRYMLALENHDAGWYGEGELDHSIRRPAPTPIRSF